MFTIYSLQITVAFIMYSITYTDTGDTVYITHRLKKRMMKQTGSRSSIRSTMYRVIDV